MFMLVSRRYERASMIVTSNKPFSGWARSAATTSSPPP
jgi:DNA replication protein DnaC